MIAHQLSFAVAPEPIAARQQQRNLERDRTLDSLGAVRAELVALADPIALRLWRENGSVTAPEILNAMRAAGYSELLAACDSRWVACICLPSRGWRAIGWSNTGSKGRPVKVWSR